MPERTLFWTTVRAYHLMLEEVLELLPCSAITIAESGNKLTQDLYRFQA